MVQTNMGVSPEEIIDMVPQTQKVKKIVNNNGEWERRTYIRIPIPSERHGPGELEKWCCDHYKEPRYLGNWFKVSGYIVLDEKTYTHWKLCE